MNTIVCPGCDTEYLPGEIYLPKHFLGQPKDIERDIMGKIILADGIEQNLTENFVCPKCGKHLVIEADVKYKVTVDSRNNFSEDFTVPIYTDRVFLKED